MEFIAHSAHGSSPSRPSNATLTMAWLARLQRGRRAEAARERARLTVWESEGGSFAEAPNERYRTDTGIART